MTDRLQKIISQAGLMSRRNAEQLISDGRVTIDGKVAVLGDRGDAASSVVEIDGTPIPIAPGLRTFLVNKPLGVICTVEDTHGRQTIVELVDAGVRVWPVGRLDVDSEGLILVTNDGELTNRITHPSFGVTKTYTVMVDGMPSKVTVRKLTEGVVLDDGPASAIAAKIVDRSGDITMLEMVMSEGRNREIRRMCESIGHPVNRLVRTAIGSLRDRTLEPGAFRELTTVEVADLYKLAEAARTSAEPV